MDLLRVFTCGSVDDGKSTLIGRLLYDSKSVFQEHLQTIEGKDRVGDGELNLALLTDGLRAEREQGITIDVAYKYFSTPKRKFILADTPGHVQYTRNMVTGASLADCAIILIDARQGILEQTRRHSFIAHLLEIPHLIVCINKMDLVDFSEKRYQEIKDEFSNLCKSLSFSKITLIPISALKGDNIVNKSTNMPWYRDEPLLDHLESWIITPRVQSGSRFLNQYIIRPQDSQYHDFRGYAGIIRSGEFQVGDKITVYPQNLSSTISEIWYSGVKTTSTQTNDSVIFQLEDDMDISRGDIFVRSTDAVKTTSLFRAKLTHLDSAPLKLNSPYEMMIGTRLVKAMVKSVETKLDLTDLIFKPTSPNVQLNEIAEVTIKTATPILFDSFESNWATGSAILIDPQTHMTAAALMFEESLG